MDPSRRDPITERLSHRVIMAYINVIGGHSKEGIQPLSRKGRLQTRQRIRARTDQALLAFSLWYDRRALASSMGAIAIREGYPQGHLRA